MSFKVCIPHTGQIDAGLVEWLTSINHKPILHKSYSVSKCRNILIQKFLNECDDDWLFFLDSDNWPVNNNLFNFIKNTTEQILFVPTITTSVKWNFITEEYFLNLKDYTPDNENYFLKDIKVFGGSGIFLKRDLLKKLPNDIWRESFHKDTTSGEDVLFSFTLTQTYKLPAFVIWNSALHHSKNGFDLYCLKDKI